MNMAELVQNYQIDIIDPRVVNVKIYLNESKYQIEFYGFVVCILSVSGFVLLLIRIEHDSDPAQFPFVPLEMISYDFPGLLGSWMLSVCWYEMQESTGEAPPISYH